MAKNCFLLVLLVTAFSFASTAQVKLGLLGGPQSANITEKNSIPAWDTTTGKYYSAKTGVHLGITAEVPMGKHFYFQPSVLYSEKGRNFSKTTQFYHYDSTNLRDTTNTTLTTTNLTARYIDVPLNIAYKLPLSGKKNVSFFVSAGPYISLFFNGKSVYNQRSANKYKDYKYAPKDSTLKTITTNVSKELQVGKKDDSYRTFGYGVNARAGFELGSVTISGFMSQGFDNLYYSTYTATFKHKVYGASLGIWLGQVKEPAPVVKDKDNDGVPDDKDACPLLAGTAITNGCPDTDKDGVNDEADKCPTVAGLAKYNGCPVPDTDNDGVNDEADKCPTVAGLAKYNGCPVPDTDGDGVNDEADKCPDAAGTAENNGCPPPIIKEELKEQVNFAAENIFFMVNSTELLSKSFKPLQTVADVLKANPALKLSVDGYTDNTGTAAANLSVSAKRAQAVKNYLVKIGVAPERISTNGFGQSNPVADNKTAEGRTKNRRVELKLK